MYTLMSFLTGGDGVSLPRRIFQNVFITYVYEGEGVYPQSDGSLAIVNIDASKGFVDLWVHLSFAIFANFDVKKQLKWLSTKI